MTTHSNPSTPFVFTQRIFFDDTDAVGVVYHANYLKFMERARSEWFLQHSIGMKDFIDTHKLVFVVSRTELDYLGSATLQDMLEISVQLQELKRASAIFVQEIHCNGKLLCKGKIRIGCVNTQTMRPAAIPPDMCQALNRLL